MVCAFYMSCSGRTRAMRTTRNRVYCHGQLLHTVQQAHLYDDSKTFVDMKMKKSPQETLNDFNELWESCNGKLDKQQIEDFVNSHFEEGNEFEEWHPPDWTSDPQLLKQINDEEVRAFTKQLVEIWPLLARKVKSDVWKNNEQYSLLPIPNGFVVPGGRFREIYYWDSYWIIQGLLVCDMFETARGMIENLAYLVQQYGFMPNGGRLYYLNRSQPPLLSLMAYAYYEVTKDKDFVQKNLKYFDAEIRNWFNERMVTFKKDGIEYRMAQYRVDSYTPRPESYSEDLATASRYQNAAERDKCYSNLKSGAESGWDFSSRWFFDSQGGNEAGLSGIALSRIIPVDLNSYLCRSFQILAKFYNILGDSKGCLYWNRKTCYWKQAISDVLWNEQDGIWYDFDIKLGKQRKYYYPSNLAPLWTEAFSAHDGKRLGKRALNYLKKHKILDFQGGIPTSLTQSGEQWDYPNAWPPLQGVVVQGLDRSGDPDAKEAAAKLARSWVYAVMKGYKEKQVIYEKYNAESSGQYGSGGEYVVQTGFGWTNGVTLEFIKQYFTGPTQAGSSAAKVEEKEVQKVEETVEETAEEPAEEPVETSED